jgi:hypothetical protein
LLLSSHGFVKLFGVQALQTFIAAYVIHIRALVSSWCFFAALLSFLVYLHLRYREWGGFPKEPSLATGGRRERPGRPDGKT